MDYGPLIDRFETVARREGVTHTREGSPNLDAKLAAYRDAWHTYLHLPINPSPADGTSADLPEPVLSWSLRDSTDTTFDIYLGLTNPPPLFRSQTGLSLTPGRLVPARTYYWQVHSINNGKTTVGPVWSFTSRAHPDFDLDGDVDLSDFGHLQSCMTGRQIPITDSNCRDADLDRDDDADGNDLGLLRFCLTGAGLFSNLTCLD
jgi:hypothetical protein